MDQKTKAYVFDLDDTLIKTQAKVIIKNNIGEVIQELSSKAYNSRSGNYGPHTSSDIDFSEFDKLEILLQEPLTSNFNKIKKIYKDESATNIFICTCRENVQMIRNWLMVHKIYLPITNIVTFDSRIYKNGTDVKSTTIKYLARRYDEIHVWEDEFKFRQAMEEAVIDYPACKLIFEVVSDF